jgi:uncharacterized Zn finger protein (UPF0148 family)
MFKVNQIKFCPLCEASALESGCPNCGAKDFKYKGNSTLICNVCDEVFAVAHKEKSFLD